MCHKTSGITHFLSARIRIANFAVLQSDCAGEKTIADLMLLRMLYD